MTEFHNLGAHCYKCKTKDFLPFKCDLCNQVFCLEHRTYEAHNCTETYKIQKQVPRCPLCNQEVPVNQGQDVNTAVELHIQGGCKKPGKSDIAKKVARVKCSKCSENAVMRCKACNLQFCPKHRHEQDHDCKSLKKQENSFGIQLGLLHKQRVAQKQRRTVGNKKGLESKFSNKKTQPIGQPSIEYEDRFPLDVFFPINSGVAPVHMFFSKRWKVGKVLDLIAAQGKIVNNNATETDPNKRLNLFNLRTGERLPTDKKLNELGLKLMKRDSVILEYGQELSKNIVEEFKKIKETGEEPSCIIS